MTPSELLSLIGEEQLLDPTLEVTISRVRKGPEGFRVEFRSTTAREVATGRRVKAAMAKALGQWNGDGEIG
ncbi:hypothetical protein SEA_DALANDE_89 [Gordonia phage DalanDe]|nr:hypothetical protein SEA_DALANDE_89 [Gordonia phage DalanDe]